MQAAAEQITRTGGSIKGVLPKAWDATGLIRSGPEWEPGATSFRNLDNHGQGGGWGQLRSGGQN